MVVDATPSLELYAHIFSAFESFDLRRIQWFFFKKQVIKAFVQELEYGVEEFLEQDRELWSNFGWEMDILRRMDLEKKAIRRTVPLQREGRVDFLK